MRKLTVPGTLNFILVRFVQINLFTFKVESMYFIFVAIYSASRICPKCPNSAKIAVRKFSLLFLLFKKIIGNQMIAVEKWGTEGF